ncbi:hypothetical protein PSTG_05436 [Puccinia striiformis f. sp. tritici PST-78]|uniref:Uncharacterized protein n=1 Tax=Puccinia striiformis f. sp. tritici PST-78 TaxID=1165861 RepID=A0A0L0VPY4_9BASI|nr:hypothetical protein PSTG_05436 [Puccinia striiformis f. sp. tritici PST-78]
MGKMGETDSSQPKENQVPPSINLRPDAPHKYHQLTHLLYPSPHPKTTSPHNPRSDSNLSYNLKYCHSSHLVFLQFTSPQPSETLPPSQTLLNLEPANHLDTILTTHLTLQTHPSPYLPDF